VLTAFEIQVLNDGDWKIDSIFDDEETARFEAGRVFGRGGYDGVRVVQEIYNETTNTTAVRTVAEMGAGAAARGKAPKASDAARAAIIKAVQNADAAEREPKEELADPVSKGAAKGGVLWWFGLIARSVAIAVGGLVVLFLLRLLYELI
jgi:hypothetical protein